MTDHLTQSPAQEADPHNGARKLAQKVARKMALCRRPPFRNLTAA